VNEKGKKLVDKIVNMSTPPHPRSRRKIYHERSEKVLTVLTLEANKSTSYE
jgi:hypothetical protein